MLLEVALNGSRTRTEHPAIPQAPDEHVREATAAVAVGAGAIHVHVRHVDGRESLAPEDVAATLGAIRGACPGVPVGVSAGAWIVPDTSRRLALIRAWDVRPDFASVNLHEAGAIDVIRTLLDSDVGVEAGVWNAPAAHLLVDSGLADRCLRVLLEPAEEPGDQRVTLERIETVLGRLGRACCTGWTARRGSCWRWRPAAATTRASASRTPWSFPTAHARRVTPRWSPPRGA